MDGFTKNPKMQCFREGGQVKYETRKEHKEEVAADINQDKKIVKKAFKMHDSQEHKGEHTDLSKLKKGGRAKKETGTVKKFDKASGQYGAKKGAADKKNIQEAKQFNPVKLKEGGTVQPGATVSQQKYYDQNKAAAKKKEAAADYEAFGSRGDAARKGMEEGRMDALSNPYKKGGKIKKMNTGGTAS